jgi:hypothetical protein
MGSPFTDLHKANRPPQGRSSERLARSALTPLRERMEQWQQQAARLHGRCFDLAARHQPCDLLYEEARQLARDASAEMDKAMHYYAAHRHSSRFAELELAHARLISSIRRLVGDA